jgi:hypothetical protein
VAKHALSSNRFLPGAPADGDAFNNCSFPSDDTRSEQGVNMRFLGLT